MDFDRFSTLHSAYASSPRPSRCAASLNRTRYHPPRLPDFGLYWSSVIDVFEVLVCNAASGEAPRNLHEAITELCDPLLGV